MYKKVTALTLLVLFSATTVLGVFGSAQPAQAQLVTAVAADVPRTVDTVISKVLQGLKIGVLNVVSGAVGYALQKIAYDSAVWIASGGKGQGALVFSKGFGSYLSDVGNDALGRGIDKLSRATGFNLCKISDPNVDLALKQALRLGIGITTPRDPTAKASCSATQFYQNNLSGDAWKSRFNNIGNSVQNQFNQALSFDVSQSDLGVQLTALDTLNAVVAGSKDTAAKDRTEGEGVKPLTDKISGDIKSPAKLVGSELEGLSNKERVQQSASQINTAIGTGEFQLLPGALATFFVNTLAGTVIKNFQEKGILPFGLCIGGAGGDVCQNNDVASNYELAGQTGGRLAAEALFNDFLTVKTASVDQFNILGELSNCPDSPGTYNCRADSGFTQALQQAANGAPFTLKDAVDKGLIRGDWKLLPPSRVAENASKNCFQNSFCYSNVKVLRQLRMVPLGFELAAELSDPDKPWTLSEVLNGFNDCNPIKDGTGNVVGVTYDPTNKPFCHLVDPNWVLKAPETRCNALVYGPTVLSPDVPDRNQECADLSTCVAYNKDGSCVNYAYCTREQNTWKFAANTCNAENRTCRAFTDSTGVSKGYIYRSLDTGFCSKSNVGCRAYSLNQDSTGAWQSPSGPTGYGSNTGIYFNNTVSNVCGAQSAGCSLFQVAADTSVNLYLRQAPGYLGCYDANPATPSTEWPQTVADLSRVKSNAACSNYAAACIPDEVGCTFFTPTTGASKQKVPAKYSAADVCDAKCVGYASYKEVPSNYSLGQDFTYIIPTSGKTCSAADAGCSGFTNLSVTAGGLEQVEYFSYLRACSLPDPVRQKNFFTYEGGATGFELKSYTLIKDAAGGPEYFVRTDADRAQYDATCNETLYKAGFATPDCRQFNDETGATFYRLLSKTIPVSESCTPYRLSSTDLYPSTLDATQCAARKGYFANGTCQLCFQGGEYRDGSCYYFGLPGSVENTAGVSASCSADVNSCRAYKGNAGNNTRDLFTDTFESDLAVLKWSGNGIFASPISVRVGGKSLSFNGAEAYRTFTLTPGHGYEVEFWAKGTGQTVSVSLRSADGATTKDFGTVSVGETWRSYRLGSVELPGAATTTTQLVFANVTTGNLFLDNVTLHEVTDLVYLVKSSLKVDPICDSNQNDNLPGEALGCQSYSDTVGNTVNLSGFSFLCREQAIGCTALYDTQNAGPQVGPRLHSVFLSGAGGTIAQFTVGSTTVSCQVPVGDKGCYTDLFGKTLDQVKAVDPTVIVPSTVYVGPVTASSSPVYLVANKTATCNAVDLGCTNAGLQTLTPTGPTYTDVVVKNNPSAYQQNLCQVEAVGCQAYTSSGGDAYFKDPALTGNKICSYQTGIVVNGVKSSGWFWKNVGACSQDKAKICTADADCGSAGSCQNIGSQPCYPTYQLNGSNYGLWSYGDKGKYNNFVGECPTAQDACTEFIDHADSDHAYYLIKDDRISQGICNGKVSQKEGCALFDETDNPNKFYATNASYNASNALQSTLVVPVVSSTNNPADANIIIKVARDRQCGEWLQCRSAHRAWDNQTAQWKMVCDAIGRCNKAPENPAEDNISNCANWVEEDTVTAPQALTVNNYVQRATDWASQDYSGLSIENRFPLEYLAQVDVGNSAYNPDWRLAHPIACAGTNCATGVSPSDDLCKNANQPCGFGGEGLCINGTCLQNIDGTTKDLTTNAPSQICRAYPEKDAPFPNSPAIVQKAARQFAGAHLCQETNGAQSDPTKANACECDYTKVKYGDVFTRYFNYIAPHTTEEVVKGSFGQVPPGICLGGSLDGVSCKTDNDCHQIDSQGKSVLVNGQPVTDGSCQKQQRVYQLTGWRGFCLEYDLSRTVNGDQNQHPCLTWYPVDYLSGTQDINNQYVSAGYQSPAVTGGVGGAYYCLRGNNAGGDQARSNDWPASRVLQARPKNAPLQVYTSSNSGYINGRQFYRYSQPANGQEQGFSLADIERIDFQVLKGDITDPGVGATFSIWPNDNTTPVNQPQTVYNTKNPAGGADRQPGVLVTGHYLGKPNEWVLMYGSQVDSKAPVDPDPGANYVDKTGKVCYPSVNYGSLNADLATNQCQDLGGNIFSNLTSRSTPDDSHFSCNTSGGCRPEPSNYKFTSVDMGSEGIWNPNFTDSQICKAYSPSGVLSSWEGNWHAIRIKFDPISGKFSGYDLAYCDQSNDDGGISYQVSFLLKEWCPIVSDVTYNPTVSGGTNPAPWTNRLWAENKKENYVVPTLGYTYKSETAPYGSLSLNSFPLPDKNGKLAQQINLSAFSILPDCVGPTIKACSHSVSPFVDPNAPWQQSFVGAPYSCPDGTCVQETPNNPSGKQEVLSNASSLLLDEGTSLLGNLFARVSNYYQYFFNEGVQGNTVQQSYVRLALTNRLDADKTESGNLSNGVPKPPMVFPVGDCDIQGHCTELHASGGISVNDVASGNVRVFTPSARMYARFFAFADANQMPLRKVTVDWGDGHKYPLDGLFRNNRGYSPATCNVNAGRCQAQQVDDTSACNDDGQCGGGTCVRQSTGSTVGKCLFTRQFNACKTNADCTQVAACTDKSVATTFGTIVDQTCDNNYVQFEHVYQCTRLPISAGGNFEAVAANCGANGTRDFPNGCCVFVPKVQVQDNWGWCNGTCNTAGGPGGAGCYDGTFIGKANECDKDPGAWTKFNGKILVAPPALPR
jgi:hypothetical protein